MQKLKTSNPKRGVLQLQQDFNDKNFTMSELIHQYEKLDRTIAEGMLAAEKTCCQSKTGYPWSLKLVRAEN
eukprot:4937811-Ditylum_brightwellii.AAC.1